MCDLQKRTAGVSDLHDRLYLHGCTAGGYQPVLRGQLPGGRLSGIRSYPVLCLFCAVDYRTGDDYAQYGRGKAPEDRPAPDDRAGLSLENCTGQISGYGDCFSDSHGDPVSVSVDLIAIWQCLIAHGVYSNPGLHPIWRSPVWPLDCFCQQ